MKLLIAFGVGVALLLSAAAAMSQETTARGAGQRKAAAQSKGVVAQMDEQMKKMQALHERMIGAMTPDERQTAIEEARKEMQAAMAMMQPAMRGAGGDADAVSAEVMDAAGKGRRGRSHAQTPMMDKRMDMMQMMMQLMMDQQGLMMSPPKGSGTAPKKK
jgi:hypothetical protein